MNECRPLQLRFPLQGNLAQTSLFMSASGASRFQNTTQQYNQNQQVFAVPTSDDSRTCLESILNSENIPQSIRDNYNKTLQSLREADSNHDGFVTSPECESYASSHRQAWSSSFAFKQAADYYTHILPLGLQATPQIAARENCDSSTALRGRLRDLSNAGLQQVFGLALDESSIRDLITRFEHDENNPSEPQQVSVQEQAAINLVLRYTHISSDNIVQLDYRGVWSSEDLSRLQSLCERLADGNESFLGMRLVSQNPQAGEISIAQMLRLAQPTTPNNSALIALHLWMERQNTVTGVLHTANAEGRRQWRSLVTWGNALFMGGALAYHRIIQPRIFNYLFHRGVSIRDAGAAADCFASFRHYLQPQRTEYIRRFLNHGSVHFMLMPLLLSPIMGALHHALAPRLIPESLRRNIWANLALETGLNYTVGIPMIEWICRSGRVGMQTFVSSSKISSAPANLGRLLRNPSFVLGWALILGATAASSYYLQHNSNSH